MFGVIGFTFYFCNYVKISNLPKQDIMSAPKIELTSREKEVLELLSTGYNSKEIGEKIFISSNTVEYHRKQLLRKTNSRNVAELIGKAYRTGLLKIND